MEIDPTFGHWLAGFIAGEGCFTITAEGRYWRLAFVINLRDDDADILREIQSRLGFGQLYPKKAKGASQPQMSWQVQTLDECLQLIYVLDQFSLRARKAKDYHIWRRAVFAKSAKEPKRISELANELKEARAYKASDSAE